MFIGFISLLGAVSVFGFYLLFTRFREPSCQIIPVSVNYHYTRKCNYECGFCFHTAKSSYMLPLAHSKRGLKLLKEAGMRKVNFAGGEPFLYPRFLASMVVYCKEELHLESVSIVTNGSLVKEKFLRDYGKYIDILAVSCDSFNEATNIHIGRGNGEHIAKLKVLSHLCREYGIKFKVNTVVNRFNFDEDMNLGITAIDPFRWKCFQVLIVKGENNSQTTLRDATRFSITDEEFQQFCEKHAHNKCLVPESNQVMRSSYLILDEYMRFLDKDEDRASDSILDVGVEAALEKVNWDQDNFVVRGGLYDWTKETDNCGPDGCGSSDPKLDW